MEFKDKIKSLRLNMGATLEDIAKAVGVSKPTVQRWESGEIENMRRDKIWKLAKALHTTPAYLMGWETEDTDGEVVQRKTPQESSTPLLDTLLANFDRLNAEGQERLVDISDDMVSSGKYEKGYVTKAAARGGGVNVIPAKAVDEATAGFVPAEEDDTL